MEKQQNNTKGKNPAVEVKKQMDKESTSKQITTADGVKATLSAVGSYVVRESQLMVEKPRIPLVPHPNDPKDPTKNIENPNDPDYLDAMGKYEVEIEKAAIDAMVLFGIEIEKMPEDDKWMKKLRFINIINDSDLERASTDEYYKEFLYKKYIVATGDVVMRVASMSGLRQEDIEVAVDSFRG